MSHAASDNRSAPSDGRGAPLLEGVGLAVERGERELFYKLDFTLAPGEALQIEGPNGAGKTTLLRMICGLTLPTEGEVRWRGENIQSTRSEFFSELAFVGHHGGVKEELTPLENLRMAQAMGVPRPGVSPEEALERLGMGAIENRPCRTMSAGQKRRVALARLLTIDARLWVLDEPFTALDRKGRADIERLFIEHAAAGGMVALTTHHAVDLGDCTVRHLNVADFSDEDFSGAVSEGSNEA